MQFPEPTLTQQFLSGFSESWRLWVPLLVLLLWVGWATRRWWGGRLLLLSLGVLVVFALKVAIREKARVRATTDAWNKLRVPLPQPAKIDGLQLAAGTMVRWNNEHEGHLLTVELGAGQEVSPGMVLTGEVDHRWDEGWTGILAHQSVLRGWECAAGKVNVDNSGKLLWCTLAGPQDTAAGVVPAGTGVSLDPGEPSDALLHLPDAGMLAKPGDFWIGPNEWFVLYSDGELLAVPGPITRRGVALGSEDSSVVLRYGEEDLTRWYGYSDTPPRTLARPPGPVTGWRGDLGSALTCEGGQTIDKGRRVTVPVRGNLVTTTHWDSSRPKAKRVLDSVTCVLGPAE
jgi:hypothetical protein